MYASISLYEHALNYLRHRGYIIDLDPAFGCIFKGDFRVPFSGQDKLTVVLRVALEQRIAEMK